MAFFFAPELKNPLCASRKNPLRQSEKITLAEPVEKTTFAVPDPESD